MGGLSGAEEVHWLVPQVLLIPIARSAGVGALTSASALALRSRPPRWQRFPHLEDEAILAGRHGPHVHSVQHLVILFALCTTNIRQFPLKVCRRVGRQRVHTRPCGNAEVALFVSRRHRSEASPIGH